MGFRQYIAGQPLLCQGSGFCRRILRTSRNDAGPRKAKTVVTPQSGSVPVQASGVLEDGPRSPLPVVCATLGQGPPPLYDDGGERASCRDCYGGKTCCWQSSSRRPYNGHRRVQNRIQAFAQLIIPAKQNAQKARSVMDTINFISPPQIRLTIGAAAESDLKHGAVSVEISKPLTAPEGIRAKKICRTKKAGSNLLTFYAESGPAQRAGPLFNKVFTPVSNGALSFGHGSLAPFGMAYHNFLPRRNLPAVPSA